LPANTDFELMQRIVGLIDPLIPLPVNDPRYVDYSAERGSAGLVSNMALTIRLAPERTCQLLSGHRGSGKTTEINRLRHDLENTEPRYFVVYCEADKYVDENDVDYAEVLISLTRQLVIDAHAKAKITKLRPGKLSGFWEGLKNILGAVLSLGKVKVKSPILDFEFDVKQNPDSRQRLRDHLRQRATTLLEAVNEVVEKAVALLSKEYTGLVVIVDNLDRIFLNVNPNTKRTSHEALFVDASEHLRNIACHVIYTLPPALLYSPSGNKLPLLFGSQPNILPMVPVARRTGEPDEDGIARLLETVEKRFKKAGIGSGQAFSSDLVLKRLVTASGGYVRGLMTLLRSALTYAGSLPITSQAVDQAIRGERDLKITSVSPKPKNWSTLREVAKTKAPVDAEEYLSLLDSLIVLEYRDKQGPWHDVHPLAKEASEFKVLLP